MSTASEGVRLWVGKAWKIGVMMAKGAYLLNERRRLMFKLGEEAYARLKKGEWSAPELESLLKQMERVSKKIEIEERLIQAERFGGQATKGDPGIRPESLHNDKAFEDEGGTK